MDERNDWLRDERRAIAARRENVNAAVPPEQRVATGRRPWGLALSGGGIRSATFCLGMVKALAARRVLHQFDYLSTVSGGGYAGAAIGRTFQNAPGPASVEAGLAQDDRVVWWWLRKNGRYLSPAGLRDTLFAMSTMLRGVIAVHFDLFLLAIVLACLMVAPHLGAMFTDAQFYRWISSAWPVWWVGLALVPLPLFTFMWAYWFARPGTGLSVQPMSVVFAVVALILALTLILPYFMTWPSVAPPPAGVTCKATAGEGSIAQVMLGQFACVTLGFRLTLVLVALSIPLGVIAASLTSTRQGARLALVHRRNTLTKWLLWAVYFALGMLSLAAIDGASWWIASQIDRGWPAFTGGGVALLVLISIARALANWIKGSSAAANSPSLMRLANVLGVILEVAVVMFAAVVVQSVVFFAGGFGGLPGDAAEPEKLARAALTRWLFLFPAVLLYVVATGFNVDSLNASSLHNFYRARLSRSYLGVGSRKRGFDPDPLVAADSESIMRLRRVSDVVDDDDVPMSAYRPDEAGGPLHLVNVCFNQTTDDRTGEFNRDRKGRNMTVSGLGVDLGSVPERVELEFEDGQGPTLGQWIAISGAAAAPGMGANTSKGLATLLTLSGARLGYWLKLKALNGLPLRDATFLRRLSPKFAHLVDEMFATFPGSGARRWYVSDGGHFENTAVYALLKREAELIVAADCGADPDYSFGDLNTLVRLARVDFDARITIMEVMPITPRPCPVSLGAFGTLADIASPDKSSFLVLARVKYASGKMGTIIVVKPALIGSLPLDLLNYKAANPRFPQQPTADQFFDEAQWESYFRLGEILGAAISPELVAHVDELPEFFEGRMGVDLPVPLARTGIRAPREAGGLASQVVKSSLGIGAVVGLLVTLWQTLDKEREKVTTERRLQAESLVRAIDRSVDDDGNLRVNDATALYLRNVLAVDREASLRAKALIDRLRQECEARTEKTAACNEILVMDTGPKEEIEKPYWPGSAIDKDVMVQSRDRASAAPPPATTAPTLPAPQAAPSPLQAALDACRRPGPPRVRVYAHVYDQVDFEDLTRYADGADLKALATVMAFPSIDNVVKSAQGLGARAPRRYSEPTFLYHAPTERECAAALAALFQSHDPRAAVVRPLPEHLEKRPGVIELWVPPKAGFAAQVAQQPRRAQ